MLPLEYGTSSSSGPSEGWSVYDGDATSMTFAISVSLGLDVTLPSSSTDSPTFQYEPSLADIAPMEFNEQKQLQAELTASPDQRSSNSRSAFEIQQAYASPATCYQTQFIPGDSRIFHEAPSPTELASIEIVAEQQPPQRYASPSEPANPILAPSSTADQHPTSVSSNPAVAKIPLREIQNLQVPESSKTCPENRSHQYCGKDVGSIGKKFLCDVCDKNFASNYSLARHKRTHTGEKNFACNICDESYTDKHWLKMHMTIHNSHERFACDSCDKTFSSNYSLARHERTHTGEKNFACNICDKSYTDSYWLKRHVMTIHNSHQEKFACDNCDKTFPSSYNLARHKRTHTNENKFACEICPKSFRENYLLKRHMTIHNGEEKFACDICNKRFTRNGSLARHMRSHTSEKTFVCRVCDKRFAREDVLKSHTRTHAEEKSRVLQKDSLPAPTDLMDLGEQQEACIDASCVYVAYPTLVPSPGVILVKVNTAKELESAR